MECYQMLREDVDENGEFRVVVRVKPRMSSSEYAAKLQRKELNEDGSALIPDGTPMAPPLGYIKQPTITERLRDMVRSEHLRIAAEAAGAETFEEANDFDVGDDYDPNSPYEEVFDPPVNAATSDAAPAVSSSTGVPTPPSGGGGEGAVGGSEPPPSSSSPTLPPAPKAAPGPT